MKTRFRALLLALVLLAPAAAAQQHLSSDPAVMQARALVESKRFGDALQVLRALDQDGPGRIDVLFLTGLAAMGASQAPGVARAEREALLDEAIAALRAILVDQPGLVRVRLELARAFFYKEEDDLAREHFQRVLAGRLPAPVAANVQRFLAAIRARRRWTMYLGASVAPDSNIGGGSDEEIIYIFNLPFRRDDAQELTTSGIGASIWTGGEYQYPLGERWRLRTGADLAWKEHSGREFDDVNLSVHAGPRWLVSRRTELSVLANVRRRWTAGNLSQDDTGVRIEARRRLTPRLTANARGSWHRRDYRGGDSQDGPVIDASLGGTWTITPIVQANAAFGLGRVRPAQERSRNDSRWLLAGVSVALPRGINAGATGTLRRTRYEGNWSPFTPVGVQREDRTRTLSLSLYKRDLTVFGFSPQVVVTREVRSSNAQLHGYQRTRGEIRFVRQF